MLCLTTHIELSCEVWPICCVSCALVLRRLRRNRGLKITCLRPSLLTFKLQNEELCADGFSGPFPVQDAHVKRPSYQINVTLLLFSRNEELSRMFRGPATLPTAATSCCPNISSSAPLRQNKICAYVCRRSKGQNERGSAVPLSWVTLVGGRQRHHECFMWDQRAFANRLSELCTTSGLWSSFQMTGVKFWVWSTAAGHFLPLAGRQFKRGTVLFFQTSVLWNVGGKQAESLRGRAKSVFTPGFCLD